MRKEIFFLFGIGKQTSINKKKNLQHAKTLTPQEPRSQGDYTKRTIVTKEIGEKAPKKVFKVNKIRQFIVKFQKFSTVITEEKQMTQVFP